MVPKILSAQRLRELLHYDPDTGVFIRIASVYSINVGAEVGGRRTDGYIQAVLFD